MIVGCDVYIRILFCNSYLYIFSEVTGLMYATAVGFLFGRDLLHVRFKLTTFCCCVLYKNGSNYDLRRNIEISKWGMLYIH